MGNTPRYMHLMTDYAFKRIFGSEETKQTLILFLNDILEGKETITDVTFLDKEQLPFKEDNKRVVFDIYCTTTEGSHIIIEMQRTIQPTFSERALVYCSHALLKQIRKGNNYEFAKVYGIFLMDFHILGHSPKMVRKIGLIDEDSKEVFSDKLNMIFLDLCTMQYDSFEKCKNQLEQWLFLIKNLETMNEKPKDYPIFDELFEAADLSHLANEEVVSYSQSRMKLEDDRLGMAYFGEQKRIEGRKEGRIEGIQEGETKMLQNIVKKLRDCGMSISEISSKLGYNDTYIASLDKS
ncbi:MAG: Rpn family recombination-promoting nuclease/putative transposase [Muribaculaceae bacterium]|nr:Rpn family recombination-promoting nuclease/putative transposase [Muribaculaceae bacterium]